MAKGKGKKKQSKNTGNNSSNGDMEAKSARKPKMPFEVKAAHDLRGHTVDELIALTRATDEWTDEVKKWCASKVDIRLFGSPKDRALYVRDKTIEKSIGYFSIDFVFNDGKMREEKMLQLAQDVIGLFPNLYGFLVCYHPPLNQFFPLLIEQIATTSSIKLRMVSLDRAPKGIKWLTKWWTAISLIPVLKGIQLKYPGELPSIIYEHANRLVHVRVASVCQFDWNLVSLFKQFGSSLEALELKVTERINCDLDELDRLLEERPRIGVNLVKLHFSCFRADLTNSAEEEGKLLRLIVKRFPKLQVFHFTCAMKLSFEEIYTEISKLTKLEELCITALHPSQSLPASIDHLVPSATVVRMRIFNPIDEHFPAFGRIVVPLFPNLTWISVCTEERATADQFIAQFQVWYPDRERTKYEVSWHGGLTGVAFEDSDESPMDKPAQWTCWKLTKKCFDAVTTALADVQAV